MGCVFKARQPQLNRVGALKILPEALGRDPAFATRFTREAQALASLSHPNIVTIHDFGQAGGFFYLLMEFVDGVNLRQALHAGRFTPEQALAIVPPLCDALQFAHDRGIVHRDIKPENLLLDREGRVKIADFGIAKILTLDGGPLSLSLSPSDGERVPEGRVRGNELTGAAAGTPGYMAPEQKSAPRTVDSRADIYSLGVVFYEMLTGELPAEKLQPPSRKVQIDVRLDEIVLRALEVTPALRYQTATELRMRIEAMGINSPLSSTTPGRNPSNPPHRRTGKWISFQLGFTLVFLTLTLLAWTHRQGPAGVAAWTGMGFMTMGCVLFSLSLPLWLGLMPMNPVYGFRIPQAFISEERWYDVQRQGGLSLMKISGVIVLIGLIGLFVLPRDEEIYALASTLMMLVALLYAIGHTCWWARKLPGTGPALSPGRFHFWGGTLVFAVALAFTLRLFVVQPFKIPSNSLAPELPAGSRFLVWKLGQSFAPGDLIAYWHEQETYVGRVVQMTQTNVMVNRNGTNDLSIEPETIVGRVVSVYWRGGGPGTPTPDPVEITAATKAIQFSNVTNFDNRNIVGMSSVDLAPGEKILSRIRLSNGRIEESMSSHSVTVQGTQEKQTVSLFWPLAQGSPAMAESAAEQARRFQSASILNLAEGRWTGVFSVTNEAGISLQAEALYQRTFLTNAAAVAEIWLRPGGWPTIFFRHSLPEGTMLVATSTNRGSATGHSSIHQTWSGGGLEGHASWFWLPSSTSDFTEGLNTWTKRVEQLRARGPIRLRPGERWEILSITNQAGEVFSTAFELRFTPPPSLSP